MSDFEERIADALADGAEGAPSATGLALAARGQARARRRRLTSVAAAVAVAAIAVPAVLAARDDGAGPTPVAVDPDNSPGPVADVTSWHTVRYDGEPVSESGDGTVLLDVPNDWERLDTSECEFGFVRFGPTSANPCDGDLGVSLYGSATFDAINGPGLSGTESDEAVAGYVYTGQFAVYVSGTDEVVARRVLGSARPDGVDIPDLSGAWAASEIQGVTVDAPATGVEVEVVAVGARTELPVGIVSSQRGPSGWFASSRVDETREVRVQAPTQALAELVAATGRNEPARGAVG
ncbi:MAG: hypothetical protein WB767_12895 [Nocardioides sp.]